MNKKRVIIICLLITIVSFLTINFVRTPLCCGVSNEYYEKQIENDLLNKTGNFIFLKNSLYIENNTQRPIKMYFKLTNSNNTEYNFTPSKNNILKKTGIFNVEIFSQENRIISKEEISIYSEKIFLPKNASDVFKLIINISPELSEGTYYLVFKPIIGGKEYREIVTLNLIDN